MKKIRKFKNSCPDLKNIKKIVKKQYFIKELIFFLIVQILLFFKKQCAIMIN